MYYEKVFKASSRFSIFQQARTLLRSSLINLYNVLNSLFSSCKKQLQIYLENKIKEKKNLKMIKLGKFVVANNCN